MDGVQVIDVHGAGCQRSDPKDGDPRDYPAWGFGPQGDLQRVFNQVWLVRGGSAGSGTEGEDGDTGTPPPRPFRPPHRDGWHSGGPQQGMMHPARRR